jgi:hypothetical protein
MTGNKISLKDTIKLAGKIEIKKTEKNLDNTEQAVKKIHSSKEQTIRVSLDLPLNVYLTIKSKVALNRQTLRDYLLSLIHNDNNAT